MPSEIMLAFFTDPPPCLQKAARAWRHFQQMAEWVSGAGSCGQEGDDNVHRVTEVSNVIHVITWIQNSDLCFRHKLHGYFCIPAWALTSKQGTATANTAQSIQHSTSSFLPR